MGGISRTLFNEKNIERDIGVASGKLHWMRDSQGLEGPGVDATEAEKSAALDAYVERLSSEYNKENHFVTVGGVESVTAEQVAEVYVGLPVDAKAEAITSGVVTLVNQNEPITEGGLRLQQENYGQAGGMTGGGVTRQEDSLHHYQKTDGDVFDRNQASVYEHQPHAAFAALSGERTETTYEEQQNPPFSGENKNVRHYSPFTIALLPPKEISALNTGSSANKDPYSWSSLGKLTTKLVSGAENIMATPKTNTNYYLWGFGEDSEAVHGDSKRLGTRSKQATKLDQTISELSMLVYEGQISTQTEHTLQGSNFEGAHKTPLISVANIADIYMQMLDMFRTPPLLLLVNPTSMNVTYAKIQAHQERTRYGYIFQAWGEQLPVLNFSGRIGAFYGGESPGGRRRFMSFEETTHVSGVQEASRRVSPAFQNLMNLMKLYKNNAFIRDNVGGSQANHLVGMVELSYDGARYIGHFDKLEFTFEESNNLGGVNFSFDFTATEIRRNADERHVFVKKMNNPNQGGRFGDGRDQTHTTMDQYLSAAEKHGAGAWSNNDFNDDDPETPGFQNEVLESWEQQTATGNITEDGDLEVGWGVGGVQVKKLREK